MPAKKTGPQPEGYTVKTWKDWPLYQCNYCTFNSLDNEPAIRAHIRERHSRVSPIVDEGGRPVVVEE